ncbi:YshB family small membrane protein [Erwinia sp. CPCC 100877]|nr:YshB family small membrane protein [Erwinia sp. CPCC 100877]
MLESLINVISSSADVSVAASQSPHAAIAALLCAALFNFFS